MSKVTRALIGGNWKCNGTKNSVASMIDVLNAAGALSPESEVVIAGPAIHLSTMKQRLRPDIATCAEDVSFKTGYGAMTGEMSAEMLVTLESTGHSLATPSVGLALVWRERARTS